MLDAARGGKVRSDPGSGPRPGCRARSRTRAFRGTPLTEQAHRAQPPWGVPSGEEKLSGPVCSLPPFLLPPPSHDERAQEDAPQEHCDDAPVHQAQPAHCSSPDLGGPLAAGWVPGARINPRRRSPARRLDALDVAGPAEGLPLVMVTLTPSDGASPVRRVPEGPGRTGAGRGSVRAAPRTARAPSALRHSRAEQRRRPGHQP